MYCVNACNLPYGGDCSKLRQAPRTRGCGWSNECLGEGWISKQGQDRCSKPGTTSLLRTLPWRHALVKKPPQTSMHTGMSKEYCQYDSGYAGDGCPTEPMKFPNLVTGFNVNAGHAARTALYTRYSAADWQANLQTLYNGADCTRQTCELVRAEAMRLVRETDDRATRGQGDATKKLGERLKDLEHWKKEIMRELDLNVADGHKFLETRQTLERMIREFDGPLHIAQECLYARESREGVDLAHDLVEQALLCEIETLRNWQAKLCQNLDGFSTHLAKLRASRHELERDLERKENAYNIDTSAAQLTNDSMDIAFHSGIEKIDPTVSIPETWAGFTQALLKRAKTERNHDIKPLIDNLITQAMNEAWAAWNNTNNAFTIRIAEQLDAKNKLLCSLNGLQQELYDLEKHMDLIKKAIDDKANALKVAQTRLEKRTHRQDIELCRDEAHFTIVQDVHDINECLEQLQRKLGEVEAAHQQLLKTKTCLEHDLKVKANSLFIDREKCMGLRKSFPVAHFVANAQQKQC